MKILSIIALVVFGFTAYGAEFQIVETATVPACFMREIESLQSALQKMEDQASSKCLNHSLQAVQVAFTAPCGGASVTGTYNCFQN